MEMNKKLKIGKKVMAMLTVLLIFMGNFSNVFAASGTGSWKGYQYSTFLKTSDTTQFGITARSLINTRTGESHTVFCSELGVDFDNGVVYNGSYYTPTSETLKKACKVAYFGWYSKYGDYVVNEHIRDGGMEQYRQDYAFTQQYIWEVMGSNATFVDSSAQAKYVSFKTNINNQINSYSQRPSFDSTTVELDAGETKVITDTNGILKYYNSINATKDGVSFSHTKGENTLKISVPENFEGESLAITDETTKSWGFMREGTEDNDSNIYFDLEGGGQDQLIALNYNDPTLLKMKLQINSLGNLELTKLNANKELIDGAVFTVNGVGYNGDVTVKNGKITLEKIKKGIYTIKEKSAPNGYLLDTETYTVEVKANQTVTQAIVNQEPTGNFVLTKKNADKSKNLKGAEYRIWNNSYDKTFTTDNNGKIEVNGLKLGKYNYQEIKAPEGYLLDDKVYTFELAYKDQTTSVVYASAEQTNIEPTGNFVLTKKNSDKSKNLKGAEYRIWNDGYDKTFTTDSNGKIEINGLKLGKYNYQETKASEGYLLDNKVYTFELAYKNQTTSVVYASAEQTNKEPTGNFVLTKKNADKSKNLKGAEYRIWNDGYDKTFTTDSNGKIEVNGLKLGKYNYQEIKAPNGYLLDDKVYNFELAYKDQTTSVVYASAEQTNSEPTGTFTLTKKNADKSANIKGAEYRIWNDNYDKTFTTDDNGKIEVKGLKLGKYNYQEIKAPEGYLLDDKIYTFELNYKDQVTSTVYASVEKTDDEPFGEITIRKEDTDLKNAVRVDGTIHHGDVNIAGAEYTLYANDDIYNKAKTIKHFSKDEEIATFTFDEKGVATIKVISTNGNLKVNGTTLTGLALGTYYSKETKAPEGYIQDTEKHTYTLTYKDSSTKTISTNGTVTNKVKKAKFEVIKISGKDNKTAKVVEGAEFTAILTKYVDFYGSFDEALKHLDEYSEDEYSVFKTDKTGHGVSNLLAYGDYTVNETVVPSPEINKVEEFYVTLDKNSSGVIKELVENDTPFESYLKIIKIDQNTGKKITFSNATFKLYKLNRDTNEWEEVSCKIGKERTFTWTTDEMAIAYTEDKLEGGTYKIDEIKVPTGFVKLEEDCIFEINNKNKTLEYDEEYDAYITVTVGNKQPTTNITINKTIELAENVDLSLVDVTDLSRIKFGLSAKENIVDMADGSVIYKKGAELGIYSLKQDGTLKIEKLPLGTYELQEVETLKGLALDNTKHEIVLAQEDDTTTVYEHNENIVNKAIIVEFSKTDINGDEELEGATLQVIDEENNVVDEWVSGKTTHKIEGLEAGKTYKLIETIAPEGYAKSTEIEFTLENTNAIQKVTMVDKIVEMSKIDIGGEEIEGAKIQVYNRNREIVDEWISTKESHKIKNLKENETYVLHEEITSDGYVKATDITFTVTTEKENQHIEMIDKIVDMSKVDFSGEEIEGAEMQVTDKDGNVVDEWKSTKESHKIRNLEEGKSYILHEIVATEGYVKATDIDFTVTTDKENQHIEMIDKIVDMSKVDVGGKEIEGAEMQVTDEDGNVVDEWKSTKESHKIRNLEEGKSYTLHEIVATEGYVKATDIDFTVTTDKGNQHIEMIDKIVEITKTDLTTSEEIEGAELHVVDENDVIVDEWISTKEPHKVRGLEEGKTYKLVEFTAPYGYELAEEITFTVSYDKETQHIEMKDMPILKNVKLIKVDEDTKEVIKDNFTFGIYEDEQCTKLVQKIESNNDEGTVTFENLRYGNYFIKEISAPKNYLLSERVVEVEINDTGVFVDGVEVEENDKAYSFEFTNRKIETPKTGAQSNRKFLFGTLLLSGLGVIAIIFKFRKKENI